jgi:hypothetical protein
MSNPPIPCPLYKGDQGEYKNKNPAIKAGFCIAVGFGTIFYRLSLLKTINIFQGRY